jgi:hypothetical protein
MDKKQKKNDKETPAYDDDRFYETSSVISQTDFTGLQPRPPITEGDAEAYDELYPHPQPTEPVDNRLQNLRRPGENHDLLPEKQ